MSSMCQAQYGTRDVTGEVRRCPFLLGGHSLVSVETQRKGTLFILRGYSRGYQNSLRFVRMTAMILSRPNTSAKKM